MAVLVRSANKILQALLAQYVTTCNISIFGQAPCVLYISLISFPLKQEDTCACDTWILWLYFLHVSLWIIKASVFINMEIAFIATLQWRTPLGKKISCHTELFLLHTSAIWLEEKMWSCEWWHFSSLARMDSKEGTIFSVRTCWKVLSVVSSCVTSAWR